MTGKSKDSDRSLSAKCHKIFEIFLPRKLNERWKHSSTTEMTMAVPGASDAGETRFESGQVHALLWSPLQAGGNELGMMAGDMCLGI